MHKNMGSGNYTPLNCPESQLCPKAAHMEPNQEGKTKQNKINDFSISIHSCTVLYATPCTVQAQLPVFEK